MKRAKSGKKAPAVVLNDRMTFQPADLLKATEVAAYLGISPRTLERVKDLPWTYASQGSRRMLFSSLLDWLRAREIRRGAA